MRLPTVQFSAICNTAHAGSSPQSSRDTARESTFIRRAGQKPRQTSGMQTRILATPLKLLAAFVETAQEACAPEIQRLCCSSTSVRCRSQIAQQRISRMLRTAPTNRKTHPQQQLRCQPRRMMAGMSRISKMSLLTVQSQQAGRQVLPRKALQTEVLLMLQGKARLHKEQPTAMTCSELHCRKQMMLSRPG